MECTLQVGDKVTPVDDRPWPYPFPGEILPQFGEVYTIRSIWIEPRGVFLRFVELVNPEVQADDQYGEPGYGASEFRRVINTDISELQSIARKAFDNAKAGQVDLVPSGAMR